jgi:hypothetical protein
MVPPRQPSTVTVSREPAASTLGVATMLRGLPSPRPPSLLPWLFPLPFPKLLLFPLTLPLLLPFPLFQFRLLLPLLFPLLLFQFPLFRLPLLLPLPGALKWPLSGAVKELLFDGPPPLPMPSATATGAASPSPSAATAAHAAARARWFRM